MAVIPTLNETCSIGLASALFDMSDAQFVRQYIRTGRLRLNKLHQLPMRQVRRLYDQTPDRQKAIARAHWQMFQAFKENPVP